MLNTRNHFYALLCAITALVAFAPSAQAETVLITGANQGIGLEFARQYAARGWTVIATHRRNPRRRSCSAFTSNTRWCASKEWT